MSKSRNRRGPVASIIFCIVISAFLLMPGSSRGDEPGGGAANKLQTAISRGVFGHPDWLCKGTRAYTLAYTNPVPQETRHVASIYVYRREVNGAKNVVEMGWHQGKYGIYNPDGRTFETPLYHQNPCHFWAIAIQEQSDANGNVVSGGYWNRDICQFSYGTTSEYCVQYGGYQSPGVYRYNFYSNGTYCAGLNVQLQYGWGLIGCERVRYRTDIAFPPNAGTFTSLRKWYPTDGGFTNWEFNWIQSIGSMWSDTSYVYHKRDQYAQFGPTVEFLHL